MTDPADRRLRVATFNLENLDDRPGRAPSVAARATALRPQLRRLDADVLCLQEVNAQGTGGAKGGRALAALDALIEGTPYAGFERLWTKDRGGKGALDIHNLVILSRFPIRAHRQLWNELVPAPLYRPVTARPPAEAEQALAWDRPLLYAELALAEGRRLHVVNLHLRAPLAAFVPGQKRSALAWKSVAGWAEGFFMAAVKRTGQALEARLLVEGILDREPDALVAVCGDFNADIREMPTRVIRGDPGDTGSAALAARALQALEATVAAERRYSVIHAGERVLLDHLLVSPPLARACREAEIHNEGLQDEAGPAAASGRSPFSFHAPVVATFDLASPAC